MKLYYTHACSTVVTVLLSLTFSSFGQAQDNCFTVQGTFTSQAQAAEMCSSPVYFCTQGVLSGGLNGDYEFVAEKFIPAQEATVPAANFYTGYSSVHSHRGELYLTDTGALDLASGRISALLTVSGGSEYYTRASGYLFVNGFSDPGTGTNTGRYKGQVCVDSLY